MGPPSLTDKSVCGACLYSNPGRDKRFVSSKRPDRLWGPNITLFSEQWGLFSVPPQGGGLKRHTYEDDALTSI